MNDDENPFLRPRHMLALWVGVLTAPLAWALQMAVNYALVPHLCHGRHGTAAVQLIGVAAIAGAVAGLLLCLRHWRDSGGGAPGDGGAPEDRTRFLAVTGLALGVLLLASIVAQVLPSFWISPCD